MNMNLTLHSHGVRNSLFFNGKENFSRLMMAFAFILLSGSVFAQISVSLAGVAPTCAGYTNGSITATVTGGWSPYSYTWSNGYTGGPVLTGVSGGTYSVTVEDVDGALNHATITINAPIPIEISFNQPDICAATGEVTVTATGGTAPYSYHWDSGQTTATAILSDGGHFVTVTDANGCLKAGFVEVIAEPLSLDFLIQGVQCFGFCDASITAIVTGGNPPYTYLWNNGVTSSVNANLPSGTFAITVTDESGCTISELITIGQPTAITLDITINNPACGGAPTGSATATASGGVGPYEFEWSNGDTGPTADNLGVGTYFVTVTDATGCEEVEVVQIIAVGSFDLDVVVTDAGCGTNNGSLTATPSGGVAPYVYEWDNGGNTATINNLAPGTYTVTATDFLGCAAVGSGTVEAGDLVEINLTSMDATCGVDNGMATVEISGGVAPYTITWSDGHDTETIMMLEPGNYSVTVVDANGCTASGNIDVNGSTALNLTFSSENAICTGANGSASVFIMGGMAPYVYTWSNGSDQPTIENITAGTYSITVTDQLGCEGQGSVTVETTVETILVDIDVVHGVSACGATDGELLATATSGTAPYTYAWSSGQNSNTATGLGAGTYTVTATDSNGCTGVASETLTAPIKIGDFVWNDLNKNGIQEAGEPGVENVAVILEGTDINGNSVELVVHTDENGMYMFNNLTAGVYTVEFTGFPPEFQLTLSNAGGNDALDSDVNLATGVVNVNLDANECDLTIDAGIYDNCDQVTDAGIIEGDEVLCGPGNDAGPITSITPATGGTGVLHYMWMYAYELQDFNSAAWNIVPGANGPSYDPGILNQTTYFVRCAFREGCNYVLESNVVVKEVSDVAVAQISSLNEVCVNQNVTFTALNNGAGATYSWNFGPTADPTTANTQVATTVFEVPGYPVIHLTVTNDGCTSTAQKQIFVGCNPGLLVSFDASVTSIDEVYLNWIAKDELQTSLYQVQRSKNNIDFETIGNVQGIVDGDEYNFYFFVDENPMPGRTYYRLMQISQQSPVYYSEIAMTMIHAVDGENIMLYPNPAEDLVYFEVLENYTSDISYELFNAAGQLVYSGLSANSDQRPALNINHLSAGIYMLRVQYDNKVQTIKLTKG